MRFFHFFLSTYLLALTLCNAHPAQLQDTLFDQENEQSEEPVFTPNIRQKLLAQAYEQLCEAIEKNDIPQARSLFKSYPGLKIYAHQPLGTPLHFVKTKAMATFLLNEIGISANICDQWGEFPSQSINLSTPERFNSKEEQKALVCYLRKHETFLPKFYNQLRYNKNFHMKVSIIAMSGVLLTQIAALVKYLTT